MLTRAELRRRAQAAAATPLSPRASQSRPAGIVDGTADVEGVAVTSESVAAGDIPLAQLPDLAPEALAFPARPVETAVAAPATRRARPRPAATELPAHGPESTPELPAIDAFEAAARLFSFTGETPVQVAASALAVEDAPVGSDVVAPRRRFPFKRVAAASFTVGVVGMVGLLTVGMTTPLAAVAAAGGVANVAELAASPAAGDVQAGGRDIQAYVAPADVQNSAVQRDDGYKGTSVAELAAESGISNPSNFFTNNPSSPIQWPFAVGVSISYGFGMRSGTMHEGLDFVPGEGAPVQAIADGTVRIATESGGAFGVTVVIDHVIDGELVSSRYAHMEYGSLQVVQGQQVKVGTFIGRTGDTGRSFGAHTHVEILAGGTTPIDPLPWFREHAGG